MFPGSTLLENTELRKGINERKVEKPVENSMIDIECLYQENNYAQKR